MRWYNKNGHKRMVFSNVRNEISLEKLKEIFRQVGYDLCKLNALKYPIKL